MATQRQFNAFKKVIIAACKERQACEAGYRQVLKAETVPQLLMAWRDNWHDLVESKYADILVEKMGKYYPKFREDFHAAHVYFNECPADAPSTARVLIASGLDETIVCSGKASVYIVGGGWVRAYDKVQVYSTRCAETIVELHDRSYAKIDAGSVSLYDWSTATTSCDAFVHDAATLYARGQCVVTDHGHREIAASGEVTVLTDAPESITIHPMSNVTIAELPKL